MITLRNWKPSVCRYLALLMVAPAFVACGVADGSCTDRGYAQLKELEAFLADETGLTPYEVEDECLGGVATAGHAVDQRAGLFARCLVANEVGVRG